MTSRVWVVIPVKDFVRAKQRLAGVLSPSERRALSQAMVEDMLLCLCSERGFAGVLLVSDDPGAELLAYRYGARVLMEGGRRFGLNAAVSHAAEHLVAEGATHMLVVHGDLPCVRSLDLGQVSAALPRAGEPLVRLVPDRRGFGTNGLLCSLPAPLPFRYGSDSLRLHLHDCRDLSLPCELMPLASLALDIDVPDDLLQLQGWHARFPSEASKTMAVLDEYQILQRLTRMGIQSATVANTLSTSCEINP